MKKIGYACVLMGFFLLSGCGFHLRNMQNADLPFDTLTLEPYSPEDRFQQRLILGLERKHVIVESELKDWVLILSPITSDSTPIAYGPTGEMVREKIRMNLTYTLMHHKVQVKKNTLWAERQHQIDYSAELATDYDKMTVLNEMETDLLSQLYLQLSVPS